MDVIPASTAERDLDRARSDYLAVSRGAHLYATEDDHAEAERRAWERLERALMTVQAERAAH